MLFRGKGIHGLLLVNLTGFQILTLLLSGAGRCREAQLASIRQMSGQVLRGSAVEYQADERAGVAGLSWRVSGR